MSIFSSIYGRTVSLVVVVFLASFAVLGLAFVSISSMNDRDRVRELERTILMANSSVRDFIITRDPTHAKNTELLLQQGDDIVVEGLGMEGDEQLHTEMHLYLHVINQLIETFDRRGFYEGSGLEGEIRSRLADIETILRAGDNEQALVALLEARKNEKNYLLRGRREYSDGLHSSVDQLMTAVSRSTMPDSMQAGVIRDLELYQHDFDELVFLTEKVTWIQGELDYLRDAIAERITTLIDADERKARLFLWAALGLMALCFVVGVAYASYIARSVVKPLKMINRAASSVAQGEKIEDLDLEVSPELTGLANSFNEIKEQIEMRLEAEEDLQAKTNELEQYAGELEAANRERKEKTRELEEAFEKLKIARDQAQHAAGTKAAFFATMSHEIRTPLNGIIGMISLLQSEELEQEQMEIVKVIQTSGESLLGIVNDILDFSKIEAGGVDLEEESFSLSSCIEDALGMVSRQAAEKDLDLSYLVSTDVPARIRGDMARIRQILVNLLANAVKFTNSGEIQVRVEQVTSSGQSAELRFEVEDTGIGIAPEHRESLFHPFSQAEASTNRKFGGTGLGLSISRQLAELMGGTMWVESEPGQGSTFQFTIRVGAEQSDGPDEIVDLADMRCLILSEKPMIGQSLCQIVESFNGSAHLVDSAEEARRTLEQYPDTGVVVINEGHDGIDGVAGFAIAGMLSEVNHDAAVILTKHINDRMTGPYACLLKPVRRFAMALTLESHIDEADLLITNEEPPDTAALISEETDSGRTRAGDRPSEARALRALLVEDNLLNQKVAVRMLEKIGFRVDIAGNGVEALSALERRTYPFIFMDLQMPEMDGLEATEKIRQLDLDPQPYIVALTANATTEDRARCMEAGMNDYASKPVNPRTLETIVSRSEMRRTVSARRRQSA